MFFYFNIHTLKYPETILLLGKTQIPMLTKMNYSTVQCPSNENWHPYISGAWSGCHLPQTKLLQMHSVDCVIPVSHTDETSAWISPICVRMDDVWTLNTPTDVNVTMVTPFHRVVSNARVRASLWKVQWKTAIKILLPKIQRKVWTRGLHWFAHMTHCLNTSLSS